MYSASSSGAIPDIRRFGMSRNTPGGSDPATISKLMFLVPGVYKLTNSEKILVTVNIIILKRC